MIFDRPSCNGEHSGRNESCEGHNTRDVEWGSGEEAVKVTAHVMWSGGVMRRLLDFVVGGDLERI